LQQSIQILLLPWKKVDFVDSCKQKQAGVDLGKKGEELPELLTEMVSEDRVVKYNANVHGTQYLWKLLFSGL